MWVWDAQEKSISKYGIISKRLSLLGLYMDKQKETNDASGSLIYDTGSWEVSPKQLQLSEVQHHLLVGFKRHKYMMV